MTTITVYLNEARGASFDGFDRTTALLVEGFTFDLDRPVTGGNGVKGMREAVAYILDDVFTQLNVAGDLYPHTDISRAYRAQDRRSLSVGDLVVVDGVGTFTPGFAKVVGQEIEEGTYVSGWTELSGATYAIARGLERHVATFGDTGVRDGVMA